MRNIRTAIISSGLLFAVAGCTSSGNDFFSFLGNAGELPDASSSAAVAKQTHAPRLALAVSHGAVLGDDSVAAGQGERMENWLHAAESGDASAQHRLGYMYAMGDGVAPDLVAAYTWLNLAAINLPPGLEHDRAVANREIVARLLVPAEIAEAHRRMGEVVPAGAGAPALTAGDISIEVDFQELGFLENIDILTPI